MGLKRTTPDGLDHPEIMYVCAPCAEGAPEGCGHTDPQDIRQAPDGRWMCENCWPEERAADDERTFSELPAAPRAYSDRA